MSEQTELCRRCGRCYVETQPGNAYDLLHGLPPLCAPCWEAVHDEEPETPIDQRLRAAGAPQLPGLE